MNSFYVRTFTELFLTSALAVVLLLSLGASLHYAWREHRKGKKPKRPKEYVHGERYFAERSNVESGDEWVVYAYLLEDQNGFSTDTRESAVALISKFDEAARRFDSRGA